jgi:RNA polymerase sigma-70 factor (ECF subfamily)
MIHDLDHPLLRLAAQPNDRAAWGAVHEAYHALCWHIALRMLDDEQSAADAVQDCLLAIRSAAHRFDGGGDPAGAATAWVARIAVNTCHQHRRRRRREHDLPSDLVAPSEQSATAELLPHLRQALDDLTSHQREAVSLRYLAGLDFEGVGHALGIKSGAARVRVHRGLAALREQLARRGVTLSAAALIMLCDQIAEAASPPPPPDIIATWTTTNLPATTFLSKGVVMTISASILSAGLLVGALIIPLHQVPALVAAEPSSVSSPTPHQEADRRAIILALQRPDGAWPGEGVTPTAFALLSFLGAGWDHKSNNPYKNQLAAAVSWLSHHPSEDALHYSAAVRLMALAEAQAMTGDADLKQEITSAVNQLLAHQHGGGWPTRRGETAIDTRTTLAVVMALISVRAGGGTDGVDKALKNVEQWVARVWATSRGSGFPAITTVEGNPLAGAKDGRMEAKAIVTFLKMTTQAEIFQGILALPNVDVASSPSDPYQLWIQSLTSFFSGQPGPITPPISVLEERGKHYALHENVLMYSQNELAIAIVARYRAIHRNTTTENTRTEEPTKQTVPNF